MRTILAALGGVAVGVLVTLLLRPPTVEPSGPTATPQPATPPQFTPETDPQITSYGIGYDLASELKYGLAYDAVDVDHEAVLAGFADSLDGQGVRVDPIRLHLVLADLERSVRERQVAKLKEADPEFAALCDKNEAASKAYLAENAGREGVTVWPSGVQVQVIASGSGASPTPQDTVVLTYRGELIDGTRFADVQEGQVPVRIVTEGGREVLQRMKVGDHWRVVIPPELAHGAAGKEPLIGPNQALVFDAKLIGIQPVDSAKE